MNNALRILVLSLAGLAMVGCGNQANQDGTSESVIPSFFRVDKRRSRKKGVQG